MDEQSKWEQRHQRRQQEQEDNKPFMQQLASMPQVLQARFYKQFALAIVAVLVITVLMIYMRSWQFSVGYLFCLYFLYMALDVVWKYSSGAIVKKRLVVVKANKRSKQSIYAVMRDIDADLKGDYPLYKFHLSANRNEADLITENTVMDVYFNPNIYFQAHAWEIIGNL